MAVSASTEQAESSGRSYIPNSPRRRCSGRSRNEGSQRAQEPRNLEQLLDRFCRASARGEEDTKTTVGSIVQEIGTRSFGPLLLFAGVIMASPLSGIPGMPTSMGVLVLLITLQLLLGRMHFWLPRWLLERSVARSKIETMDRWLRPPARSIDRFLRPRLTLFARGPAVYVIGAVCALIALGVPLMEVVPFSATTAGVALTGFGLSLITRDGVLALVAFAVTVGAIALVAYKLF